MRDALKAYLALAASLTDVTGPRALAAANALVAQGEATAEQAPSLAEDLVAQARANREAVTALVAAEVDRTLDRGRLASHREVADLAARVRVLEDELRTLRATSPGTTGMSDAAKAAAAGPVQAARRVKAEGSTGD